MIFVNNLSMIFGDRLLFDEVTFNLLEGHRYAVVGANGTGKSTFLKLLAGEEQPALGEISYPRGATLGWLKQDHFHYENDRVIDVVLRGKAHLWQAMQEKERLLEENLWTQETGERLGELEEVILQQDGYTAYTLAEKILEGVGVPQSSHSHPLSFLSGGYKLRVLLAQALFNQPDILLLDEPTNHLDMMSISWLESYLKNEFKGVLVFISHDQDFLNNLSTHILDIDYGDIRLYHSIYKKFTIEKKNLSEQQRRERQGLEKKIAHLQTFVDRFRAKASKARQAQSREKQIQKIQLPDLDCSSRIAPQFQFQQKRVAGKGVLTVSGLSKTFGNRCVLHQVKFHVKRGEKIVLIGPNGVGKSTLLKSILQLISVDCGEVVWGHGVQTAYFAQDHHELLKENFTLYDWICDQVCGETTSKIRSTLGAMLFTQDEVYKNVLQISGGESARLLLGKMMLEQANVLILDEPTNHLDIEAINALAAALKAFEGTVILVSHDRHFVSQIATRVIALTPKKMIDYPGSYKEYLAQYGTDYLSREWLKQQS